MGQLIIEQIVSVDGYAADEHGGIDFFADASCLAEADEDQLDRLRDVAAIVLGRVTFGMFAGYWPDADPAIEPIAPVLNSLPKYVVSNTLDSAPWGGDGTQAGILRGDGVDAVRALRSTVEGDVIVWGSLTLTDALLRAGEVDVLRLRIVPVLIGRGRRFAPADIASTPLQLFSAQTYTGGLVVLEYDCGTV